MGDFRVSMAMTNQEGQILTFTPFFPKATQMMAVIRFIYDFLRKGELVALGYIREHPRRNLLIALDALITVSIVFGGVAYASQSSNDATSVELMRVGAMPMTSSEFIEHALAHGGRVYWLGKMEGYGISSDVREENVHFLSYVRDGSDPRDLRGREITIVTYRSSIDMEGSHQFAGGAVTSTFVTASGRIVQYDKTTMMDQLVSEIGNSNKVSIHYLGAQSLQTMEANAMALQVVQ